MSEHVCGMPGLWTMHRTSCETYGAGFKAVGDNFKKLKNCHTHFTAVGPVLKPSGPLRNSPARFKTVQQL